MRYFVTVEAFHSVIEPDQIGRLREAARRMVGRLKESGKLELGWVVIGARNPAFVVTVDSPMELG
jgi:hypothetical protein